MLFKPLRVDRKLAFGVWIFLLASFAFSSSPAHSETYPSQRVTLIVPFAPGGPTDVVSRAVASEVERAWKQPFVIDYRPGASGMTGAEYVTHQKPDGYTLLLHGSAPLLVRLFMKEPPFDPADLRPVAALGDSSFVIVAPAQLGAKTLSAFIELAKSKPKQLNFGAVPMNYVELDYFIFQRVAGIQMTEIPYASATPIITALLRNDVQFHMPGVAQVESYLQAGKLVALAYAGTRRHPKLPDVPTARELGYDFSTGFSLGIYAHAKTPEEVVQKLGRDLVQALRSPEVVDRLDKVGYQVPLAPLDWGKQIASQLSAYTEIARAIHYQPQ
jgi:tripartite-type tricarboxylate transporter receptor subunit TctC